MVLVLTNAEVFDGEVLVGQRAVVIEDGRIAEVRAGGGSVPANAEVADLGGALLGPGFIDTQVNGGGGLMFNNVVSAAALGTMAAAHRRFGTTTLMPTLITDTIEVMRQAASAVREAIAAGVPGIRGVHFEGPCLSPDRRGVHQETYFRPFSEDLAAVYLGEGLGQVIVTLAPERVGPEVIARLAGAGIVVNAGHTGGSYDDIVAGLKAGLRGFTHLYNAMTPMTNREPGVVGAALDDARSWVGLIVDGHHVHDATARNAIRSKTTGKMVLVTDAMSTVGSEQTSFELYGETIHVADGRCAREDGTLAGSALDMMSAVRNAHRRLKVRLEEALSMATLNPARYLKLDDVIGRIAPGYDADLVAIDKDSLTVRQTWVGGRGSARS